MDEIKRNIIMKSLGDVNEAEAREDDVRRGCIKDLIRLVIRDDGEDAGELFVVENQNKPLAESVMQQISPMIADGRQAGVFTEIFSSVYGDKYGIPTYDIIFPEADSEREEDPRAAFVSVGASENAFRIFEAAYSIVPIRAEQLTGACDALMDDDAEYCLMPIKSSHDGRLKSFYKTINTYDLKINSVCSVGAGDSETQFALLSKSCSPLSAPRYLELADTMECLDVISITEALAYMGHKLREVSSVPSGAGEYYNLVFELGGDFRPVIPYINLFHPHVTLTGLYDIIK